MYEVKKSVAYATVTGMDIENDVERIFKEIKKAREFIEADAPIDSKLILTKSKYSETHIYVSINDPLVYEEDDPNATLTTYTLTKLTELN